MRVSRVEREQLFLFGFLLPEKRIHLLGLCPSRDDALAALSVLDSLE